jgi:Bacterial Ig-like domain (group 3)
MKTKILRNAFFSLGAIFALTAVLPLAAVKTLIGQSQPSAALTKTLSIPAKGITVRYPDNWSVGQPTQNSWVIINVPADKQDTAKPTVRVAIGYLDRTDHTDAVNQLAEYAHESDNPSTFLVIGGWPALQRVQLVRRAQPGEGPMFPDLNMVQITTAVAADNLVVRLEADLPSNADQQLKDLVLAIGQSLTFSSAGEPGQVQQEVNKLEASPSAPQSPQGSLAVPNATSALTTNTEAAGAGSPIFPSNTRNNGLGGELEVGVSNNGTNIVVVNQSNFITSTDGGLTFPAASRGSLNISDGDSSIAFGQSGNFYMSGLSCFGNTCTPPCPGASTTGTPPSTNNCVVVAPSTNNGVSFGALVASAVCANSGGAACSLDQEHIAADRVNAGTGGADRVYVGVRNCQGNCGTNGAFVTCSPDSGATWAPLLALEMGSDFPRVAAGGDGSFYVVYVLGGNKGAGTIRIDKFNACTTSAAQMTRAAGGFPITVSALSNFAGCEVANGFGGLNRCNDGNILSGPTVTVDDTNSNHVYVGWANNTAANNENILLSDSTNGGVNWRAPVTINTNATARRFHPWTCATNGSAFVTWYDRRNATAANNDLTDYFAASGGLSAGNLVANNDEFQISTASDPQCNLWPGPPRSQFDSENCSVQPQLAGLCKLPVIPNPDTSTNTRCDFTGPDATVCPVNNGTQEVCRTGNSNPKYGDYVGNACILGRLYTVFGTGAGVAVINNVFQSFVVGSTPTTLTYTGATTGDYHDSVTLSATLTLSGTSAGVAGQTITFTLGSQSCTATTSAAGAASCDLTLNQIPGPYTVNASFAGAGNYQASNASTSFTITKEETTLSYTGDTIIANNTTVHLSGVLLEDGTVPIAGRSVVFTLGTGATGQTCTGTTDATGTAACTLVANQPPGSGVVSDNFAGDAFYLPSSASAKTFIFAFLARGSFVIGDTTAVVGRVVTFWSATWSGQNALSGGRAPASFKGFASTISSNPPVCTDTWTSRPGNSSKPPRSLPPYMGIVVSSTVTKSGSDISGNVPEIVVVKTNAGYASNPGHPGTGRVVAVYCH